MLRDHSVWERKLARLDKEKRVYKTIFVPSKTFPQAIINGLKFMKHQILIIFFFTISSLMAVNISGLVTDQEGNPVTGANIFIENTFDGTSSDAMGKFSFETEVRGAQRLLVSFIGYDEWVLDITIGDADIYQDISLSLAVSELQMVELTAGSFEASDRKKAVLLKPLDIVTTAGATGDIVGALQTLPGTQRVGEDGRLFVRGGAAYETKTFIDGMLVNRPYQSSVPDVPSRGRFSPFLFKGTLFSTGAYSAEYGQAMSSALILETQDMPTESQTGLSLMAIGLGLSHTELRGNTAFGAEVNYISLKPYFKLLNQRFDWEQAPETLGLTLNARHKTKNGMLKFFGSYSGSTFALNQSNINTETDQFVDLNNQNVYLNVSYKTTVIDDWILQTGSSYTYDGDVVGLDRTDEIDERLRAAQFKLKMSKRLHQSFKINAGAEFWARNYTQKVDLVSSDEYYKPSFDDNFTAVFVEGDYHLHKDLALRLGLRVEYSDLLKQSNVAPRASWAWKVNENSQLSLAGGLFYQTPENEYLRFKTDLEYERATHYILNYQRGKENKIFRIEWYYKDYHQLVKTNGEDLFALNNSGDGYAHGVDIFYRDKETVKNLDYWISYSWIDTKRNYRDFPETARPSFAAEHNLSVVAKKFVYKLRTQFGATYYIASGRPYNNPNNAGFQNENTAGIQGLDINLSYLTNLWGNFTVVFVSASNVLGNDQIFGYRYASQPDEAGVYQAQAIRPGADQFVFAGIFITL